MKVEEAFRHEKESKEGIEQVASLCLFYNLKDILDAAEEGTDENRLLPAMNKIWPFLVACVRNRIPVVSIYIFLLHFWQQNMTLLTVIYHKLVLLVPLNNNDNHFDFL